MSDDGWTHVVVCGGGLAGNAAVRRLVGEPRVRGTLLDKFQPLLYQVATAEGVFRPGEDVLPARTVGGPQHSRRARGRRPASLPLPRQGHHGDDRPAGGGRRDRHAPPRAARPAGVRRLARRARGAARQRERGAKAFLSWANELYVPPHHRSAQLLDPGQVDTPRIDWSAS